MNTKHKLTELQKLEVRAVARARKALPSVSQMAAKYGVSENTIRNTISDNYLDRKIRQAMKDIQCAR